MESTIKVDMLDIYNHIDKPTAIIVTDGEAGFNGILHVFLTNDSLSLWLKEKRAQHPDKEFKYVEDTLGTAVNYVIWNDFNGLSMHTSIESSLDVSKEDLSVLTDIVDSYVTMSRLNKGRISIAEAAMALKNKDIFFPGTMPDKGEKMSQKNVVRGMTFLKRSAKNETYETLAVYLTKEGVIAATSDKTPIASCKLSDLIQMWDCLHPVTIEPKRSFCVEFSPVSLM